MADKFKEAGVWGVRNKATGNLFVPTISHRRAEAIEVFDAMFVPAKNYDNLAEKGLVEAVKLYVEEE